MKPQVVGIGACVMDTISVLPKFPTQDTKLKVLESKQCGGGPVATAMVTVSKLGITSSYIGVLSDDTVGQFLLEDFKRYGVDISGVNLYKGYRSFTSNIWLNMENGSRTCVFDKGNLPQLKLTTFQKELIKQAKILLVDGNELESAIEAAKLIHNSGGTVIYDAGGLYTGVEELIKLADVLIPSEEFAFSYTGEIESCNAARYLFNQYNPKVVVITKGSKGGILYEGTKIYTYPCYQIKVVDSNGAGDVFHGAFAVALARGFSFKTSCHFASATSALKCGGFGARESVPNFLETMEYLRRNGYEF